MISYIGNFKKEIAMNIKATRIIAILMLTVLLIGTVLSTGISAASAPSKYSTVKNSGQRDVVCTSLSGTGASKYYTTGYDYETLSAKSEDQLLSALRTLMTTTHKKTTSYDNCRDYSDETDCQNEDGTIITLYTSYVTNHDQYNGGSGWNREHVWPKSLGGFETSGAGADLHHIRPSENKTNSDRGNLKYGEVSGSPNSKGNLSGILGGTKGSYYEPLDNVKGDVARICLYVYVRYGTTHSKCSQITNVFQSVDVLLDWCELDPVDTWEMGRNEVVGAIQGNRNVFIDYPEYAWLLFGEEIPDDMPTPSGMAMSSTKCKHASTTLEPASEPTCTKPGHTGNQVCNDCGKIVVSGSIIEAKGHTYGDWIVTKEPTYTETGTKQQTCSVCGSVRNGLMPELPSCKHPKTEIRGATESNCGNKGYSGDTYCTVCNKLLETGITTPSVGEHTYGEWEIVKIPTETDIYGKRIHTCSTCGKTEESILIYGQHDHLINPDTPNEDNDNGNPNTIVTVIAIIATSTVSIIAIVAIVIIKRKFI